VGAEVGAETDAEVGATPPARVEPKPMSKREVARAGRRSSGSRGQGPADGPKRMQAYRWPALILMVALLAAAIGYQRNVATTAPAGAESTSTLPLLMPTATPASSRGSTYYCAAGTARGSTAAPDPKAPDAATTIVAEETITISNQADQPRHIRLQLTPSTGPNVVKEYDLAGRTRLDVPVSPLVKAPFVAALVEADGGLVAVSHELEGPYGRTVADCASAASPSWFFPAGTTRPGTRDVFQVYNPFPDPAVLDFSFQVEDDSGRQVSRTTDKLNGVLVPPSSVVPIDITDVIQVRNQIATRIDVRQGLGRVIIEQLQIADGTHDQPKQLTAQLGAPELAPTWLFADAVAVVPGVSTSMIVYNPGQDTVEAEVYVNSDRSGPDIDPFEVTVRAGQYSVIDLSGDGRIPIDIGYWTVVHSRSGGPIAVERIQKVTAPPPTTNATNPDGSPTVAASPVLGTASTLGSPLLATQWVVPMAGADKAKAATVAIANMSSASDVTLTVTALYGGVSLPVPRYDHVTLAAGARTVVDLAPVDPTDAAAPPATPGDPAARALLIEASGPVVAAQSFAWTDPVAARAELVPFPVRDTLSAPTDDVTNHLAAPSSAQVGPGDLGTADLGTVPPVVPGSTGEVGPTGTDTSDSVAPPATDASGSVVPPTSTPPGTAAAAGADGAASTESTASTAATATTVAK
jgi:hypothetical protein